MAPPSIMGRSQGLYPERPLAGRNGRIRGWLGSAWNSMFPNGLIGPTPGGGAATAATGVPHRAPNSVSEYFGGQPGSPLSPPASARPWDQQLYGDAANMPSARNLLDYPGRSPSGGPQALNGRGPLRQFGREGLSPLFNVPPQSPYRLGSAPGMSVLGGGEMAAQDAIQGMIDQIRGGREELRNGRLRQEELRQGRFDQNWSEYANQAPLMNQYQSPQFAQTNQGLGPGGVAPMTPEEQAYMARRNAYTDQPGTSQMYDRFGAGSPLSGSTPAAMIAAEQAGRGVILHGGYGDPWEFATQRQSQEETMRQAEAQQRAGLLNSEGMLNRTYEGPYTRRDRDGDIAYTSREQALRDAGQDSTADAVASARQAKFDAFNQRRKALGLRTRDDIQGRIADRDAARTERLQRGQAQNLSRRGVSPLSAEGQSLAPELYGSLRTQRSGAPAGQGSPLTAVDGTKVTPVPPGSPANPITQGQARTAAHAMLSQRPIFRSIGIQAGASPEEMPSPSQVVRGLNAAVLQSGAEMSDADLKDLYEYASQVAASSPAGEQAFSPEGWFNQPDAPEQQWNDLATLSPQDAVGRRAWWDQYRQRHLSVRQKPPRGDAATFYGSGDMTSGR